MGLAEMKCTKVARKVFLITFTSIAFVRNIDLGARLARASACLLCDQGACSNLMLEKDLMSMNGSPVVSESYLFQCTLSVDLLDDEFRISLHLKLFEFPFAR